MRFLVLYRCCSQSEPLHSTSAGYVSSTRPVVSVRKLPSAILLAVQMSELESQQAQMVFGDSGSTPTPAPTPVPQSAKDKAAEALEPQKIDQNGGVAEK